MSAPRSVEFRVGLGSCGVANGARPVRDAIARVLTGSCGGGQHGGVLKAVGCGGMCHREPLVEVADGNGTHAVYTHVTPEQAEAIVWRHVPPRTVAPPPPAVAPPPAAPAMPPVEPPGPKPASAADTAYEGGFARTLQARRRSSAFARFASATAAETRRA